MFDKRIIAAAFLMGTLTAPVHAQYVGSGAAGAGIGGGAAVGGIGNSGAGFNGSGSTSALGTGNRATVGGQSNVYGQSNIDRNGAVLPGIEQSPGVSLPRDGSVAPLGDAATQQSIIDGGADCGIRARVDIRGDSDQARDFSRNTACDNELR